MFLQRRIKEFRFFDDECGFIWIRESEGVFSRAVWKKWEVVIDSRLKNLCADDIYCLSRLIDRLKW